MNLSVDPAPPIHSEELDHIGAGMLFAENPTAYLASLRERYGDTFLVDVFGFQLFLVFSPEGLKNFYQLEEEQASFGMATFDLIRFKTPLEILVHTDPKLFYQLLLNKKMPAYIESIDRLVDLELQRWQTGSEIDIFDAIRTLEQRVGYGLWIAEEAAADGNWQALKECFDVLSQETAFVSPTQTFETIKSGKAREKQAAAELYELIPQILAEHDANPDRVYSAGDFLREYFSGQEHEQVKVLNNIINANQGFLSNLYAAIAWVLVRLAADPGLAARVLAEAQESQGKFSGELYSVEGLNSLVLLEQVLLESVRLAQRSLTLRKVMQPVDFDTGDGSYRVQPGVYITTMLSVTNSQGPELSRFDPGHYPGGKPGPELLAFGKESVSTFGHGKHACPAQRFSQHMCKIVVVKILRRFQLKARFEEVPEPSSRQMGGVSRPEAPVFIRLQAKDKS